MKKMVVTIDMPISVKALTDKMNAFPPDYQVSLCGMSSLSILIDPENKTVLLDESDFIEEMFEDEDEYKEAMSEGGE